MPLEFMAVMATVCFMTGIPSLILGFATEDAAFTVYGVVTTGLGVLLVASPFVFHVIAAIMGAH